MSDRYIAVTSALFEKYWGPEGKKRAVFIAEKEIGRRFLKEIERVAKQNGELFLSEATIITNELSELAKRAVVKIARRHGYEAKCERDMRQLKYLYSDGYGHYSSDFYEYLVFTEITVTLASKRS